MPTLTTKYCRCVSRNFCDDDGFVSSFKSNKLKFTQDRRGLIVSCSLKCRLSYFFTHQNCVNVEKNRLGVCCIDKIILLQNHRAIRQNEPIEVNHSKEIVKLQNYFLFEVLEDDIVDIDDSKIEVDDQLFQDIFDLPQDVPVSNVENLPKPEVLMLENKSVEDVSKAPIVVINIR